jgi:dihydroorotase
VQKRGKRGDLSLRNVLLPGGREADITLAQGIVAHVGSPVPCDATIDCTGLYCIPAGVDMHVHMRGGVEFRKEDWRTGSMSALAGGVTVVVDQPNTIPPLTTTGTFTARIADARAHSVCHFAVNGGVTPGAKIYALWEAGAMAFGETFLAPSTHGEALTDPDLALLFARISQLDALATIHAEQVTGGSADSLTAHAASRPALGEVQAIGRARRLAGACRLHFCHLTTRAAVAAAAPCTKEVTPHHLFLSMESFNDTEGTGKVNPPLRTEPERTALWSVWDQIDVIASDHAPHTADEKKASFSNAPAGFPGVETMLPLFMAAVLDGKISLDSVVEKVSATPAALLGIPAAGFRVGDRADFALFPQITRKIDAGDLHSRAGWSPFTGLSAVFPTRVIMGGMQVFAEGEFMPSSPCWFAGKGYKVPQR